MIDSRQIVQLRELTGAGIIDCKEALENTSGVFDDAVDYLRMKGQKVAANKATRDTREGIVYSYIHQNGKVGVLLELLCETDFVARNEEFISLAHDLALQIAAMNPLYVKPEDVPRDAVEREKSVYREQMQGEKKPDDIKEKIITGKLGKFYQEVCLVSQSFIKDDSILISERIARVVAKLRENIQVRRFVRYAL